MRKPSNTVSSSTRGMAIPRGSEAERYTIMSPATINTSPWAKLMSRRMPYTMV